MNLYHFMLRSISHLVPTWQPWLRVHFQLDPKLPKLQEWRGLAMHPTSAPPQPCVLLLVPRAVDVLITRRAGRNPRVFWLSWVDLHDIYSTFMFFHKLRPLRTNCVFHEGRMTMKFDMRGYSPLLKDFPVQTNMSQRWKSLQNKKSVAVAARACWKLEVTWERKNCRSILSMLEVIWERKDRSTKSVLAECKWTEPYQVIAWVPGTV
jgi:hypothetical protein